MINFKRFFKTHETVDLQSQLTLAHQRIKELEQNVDSLLNTVNEQTAALKKCVQTMDLAKETMLRQDKIIQEYRKLSLN